MTKRSEILSGSVFEVPLAKDLGFAYVKLIFSKDISFDTPDSIISKPYATFSGQRADSFDSAHFETDDLLFFPWLSLGLPPRCGEKKWRLIGVSSLTEEDLIVPDYVQKAGKFDNSKTLEDCWSEEYGIGYRANLKELVYTKEKHRVAHLGSWMHRSPISMVQTLSMFHARAIGLSLSDIYTPDELKKDFWIEINWSALVNDTLDINAKPRIRRLKVLD
jgi:hypothetical protein